MNRNYFIADPDAFTVATQVVDDQAWHGGQKPLTLDEAKVSIALVGPPLLAALMGEVPRDGVADRDRRWRGRW